MPNYANFQSSRISGWEINIQRIVLLFFWQLFLDILILKASVFREIVLLILYRSAVVWSRSILVRLQLQLVKMAAPTPAPAVAVVHNLLF